GRAAWTSATRSSGTCGSGPPRATSSGGPRSTTSGSTACWSAGPSRLLPDSNGIDAPGRVDAAAFWPHTYAGMSHPPALGALLAAVLLFATTSDAQDYEIGPADVLNVTVLSQTAMSGEMTVEPDGMLNFPFLGRVKAAGLSPAELERKLVTL